MRKIFGPKRNNEGEYEIQNNKHFEELYDEPSIAGIFKSTRINYSGHVWRSERLVGRITEWKPNTKRPIGVHRQRWGDRLKEDLRTLGVRNAVEIAKDREECR